jgi:WD40 repeat protein
MLSAKSACELLAELSEELCSSIEDFRCQKKCGEIDLNFSQGELASVEAIAWSPNGNFVASGNQDSTVYFWFIEGGEDLQMTGYPAEVREL